MIDMTIRMVEPLTRIILWSFEDVQERTYDELLVRAMAFIGDATRTQIYLEVMRLTGLGALEILGGDAASNDIGRMRFGITTSGARCRDLSIEPSTDPNLGIQMGKASPPLDRNPVEKKPNKPKPSNWEW